MILKMHRRPQWPLQNGVTGLQPWAETLLAFACEEAFRFDSSLVTTGHFLCGLFKSQFQTHVARDGQIAQLRTARRAVESLDTHEKGPDGETSVNAGLKTPTLCSFEMVGLLVRLRADRQSDERHPQVIYETALRTIEACPNSDAARILQVTGLPGMVPSDTGFWEFVAQQGLPRLRFFRRPTRPESLDRKFIGSWLQADWENVKAQIQPGDEIWPFEINVRRYLGLRRGYILLRQGRPVRGIVTEAS